MGMLDTIPEAIEAIRRGEIIVVVDDEDRENEGDFLMAAAHVTPEHINFMATHGRGLICAPLTEERCDALGLDLMVRTNNAAYETPFTVSVDLLGHGCTTGISASDRARTIQALVDPATRPEDLGRPGHIFPLRARGEGVLRRPGHTEAAIDFARLAGLAPAGVIVEILNADGTMARLPECREIADRFGLKLVSIADLIAYRLAHERLIERTLDLALDTAWGPFQAIGYRHQGSDTEHLALVLGSWTPEETVPVRVQGVGGAGDLLMTTAFGKGPELHAALAAVARLGRGAVVLVRHEPGPQGWLSDLHLYAGILRSEAAPIAPDGKDYGIGAQILRDLGITRLALLTDRPRPASVLGFGLEIVETLPLGIPGQ
jgi:3,4-dihydroxy 2-butanone 4-phosphate synthase/GTP cyclohydrolase II